MLDQNAAHRFSGGGEEMAAAVPRLIGAGGAEQTQIGFVHQRRGLQRLAGFFLREFLRSEVAQLVVDQRQEFGRGRGSPCPIALSSCVTSGMRSIIMQRNRLCH